MKYPVKRVLNALLVRQGGYVTADEMIEFVYAHRRDGGPRYPRSNISSAVTWLRNHGWNIVSAPYRGYMIPWER